jgi:phage terminase small subunit
MTNKRANREEIFAREYVIDLNGKRAVIAAGYSESGAEVQASRMLRKPKVKALIAKLTEKKLEKLNVSAERILQELARIAFLDPANLFDEAGQLKPIGEVDEDTRRAIAGLDHQQLFEHFAKGQAKHVGTTHKVKLADKTRALELLGKYQKLFADTLELKAGEDLVNLISEGRKRALAR